GGRHGCTSCWWCLIGRDDAGFTAVFAEPLLESTRRSHRPMPERGLTHPKPVGHPCDEVGFCPSRQPLFGLLIGSDVTQPGRQQGIEASSTSDELARSVSLGLAVAEPERVP